MDLVRSVVVGLWSWWLGLGARHSSQLPIGVRAAVARWGARRCIRIQMRLVRWQTAGGAGTQLWRDMRMAAWASREASCLLLVTITITILWWHALYVPYIY